MRVQVGCADGRSKPALMSSAGIVTGPPLPWMGTGSGGPERARRLRIRRSDTEPLGFAVLRTDEVCNLPFHDAPSTRRLHTALRRVLQNSMQSS